MSWLSRLFPEPARPARIEPALPTRAALKISLQAVASSRHVAQRRDTFEVAKPPPGVVPRGAPVLAMDSEFREIIGFASQGVFTEGLGWLGYPYLAELTQRPEYRRISETIAREMTRKWIRLKAVGDDDKSEKIKALDAALRRYDVQHLFRRIAEIDGFFGRAHLYLDTGATDNPAELETPLLVKAAKIGKGDLRRLKVVEPIWTYPNDYNASDPLQPDYFNPKSWFVQGKQVHATRLLTFIGRVMPDMLKPAYSFGGLSLSQMAKPYVDNWIRTRQSVSDLLHSFSVSGVMTNMQATLTGAGGEEMRRRAELYNNLRDNSGMMFLDKETEEFFNVSTPLGTLDHLQAQSQEQMASVSGIPLVVLLGITPSGLNASSDGEIRSFYNLIHSQQEQLFRPNLETVIEVIQLSEFGEIDPGIGFEFESLWELDEAGQAAVRKIDADTDQVYIDMGAIGPEDVRSVLAAEDDHRYAGVDFSGPPPERPEMPDGPESGADPAEHIAASGAEAGANAGV